MALGRTHANKHAQDCIAVAEGRRDVAAEEMPAGKPALALPLQELLALALKLQASEPSAKLELSIRTRTSRVGKDLPNQHDSSMIGGHGHSQREGKHALRWRMRASARYLAGATGNGCESADETAVHNVKHGI